MKAAVPGVRVLVTSSLDPLLAGVVDIWTPNLNCLFVRVSPDEFCPWRAAPEAYAPELARGAALWWYQSCSSHGCDDAPPRPYFRGWPSYAVDALVRSLRDRIAHPAWRRRPPRGAARGASSS